VVGQMAGGMSRLMCMSSRGYGHLGIPGRQLDHVPR